jgi:hypothetical protein
MKRLYQGLGVAAVTVIGCWAALAPAHAAPPTVTPSPGYDARLQEQRAAQKYYEPVFEPVVRYPTPVPRRHLKRTHDGAH